MATKVFLRDFMTPKKIRNYLIAVVVFGGLIFSLSGGGESFVLSDSAGGMIGIGIAFTSTAYVIYTYSTWDKIRLYVALPIGKWKLLGGYFLALWLCTLLQRMSFVILVLAVFGKHVWENVCLLLLSSGAAVLINIGILLGRNAKRRGLVFANVALLLLLLALQLPCFAFREKLLFSVSAGLAAAALWIPCRETDLILRHQPGKTACRNRRIVNYFLRTMLAEKIYMVNTVCIFAFLIVLCIAGRSNPIMWNVAWCVGAVNTPLLTMLSADVWTSRQIVMLPGRNNNLYAQYAVFLGGYFVLVNLALVLGRYLIVGEAGISDFLMAAILAAVETGAAVFMEKNGRITGWQTKQELWKNPRKYVLPLIIFALVSVRYLRL